MSRYFIVFFCAMLCIGALNADAQKKHTPRILEPVGAMQMAAGKIVYTKYCVSCHQADGLGVQKMNPPLSKTSYILGDKARIIKIVLNGLSGTDIDDETYNNVMASFDYLSNDQIANVLTYVRGSFGNKASAVKPAEVAALRTKKK